MFKKFSLPKILLVLWLVFSVAYVAWGEWTRFKVFVMQRSYGQGLQDAVAKVIEESKDCKGFPINLGEQKVTLVNVECLKAAEGSQAPTK